MNAKRQPSFSGSTNGNGTLRSKNNPNVNGLGSPKLYPKSLDYESATLKRNSHGQQHIRADLDQDKYYWANDLCGISVVWLVICILVFSSTWSFIFRVIYSYSESQLLRTNANSFHLAAACKLCRPINVSIDVEVVSVRTNLLLREECIYLIKLRRYLRHENDIRSIKRTPDYKTIRF